jgi:inner membrane transporter RhtA
MAAVGLSVGGIVCSQSGVALGASLLDRLSVAEIVFTRLAVGGLILVGFYRPRIAAYDAHQRRGIVALAISLAAVNEMSMLALQHLALGSAVTYMFIGPLALSLIGSRRNLDVIWAVVAAAGIALLTGGGIAGHGLGIALALLAGLAWASYILSTWNLGASFERGDGLAVALALASILSAPGAILAPHLSAFADITTLITVLVAGILASALTFRLELAALRRTPPRVFGVLMSLEPAIAALAGLVILGQALGAHELAGIALVVTASAGASIAQEGRHAEMPL